MMSVAIMTLAMWYNWYYRKNDFTDSILKGALFAYSFIVFSLTLLSRTSVEVYRYSFIPFWSWIEGATDKYIGYEVIYNIFLFIPLGMLEKSSLKKIIKLKHVIIINFIIALVIEFFQLILKRGMFELDDIIDAIIGALIGYGIYVIIIKLRELKHRKSDRSFL